MSFKLRDEVGSSLNRLNKKRRANELLSESIPATELLVNRSGKYCCKLCPHWPVFDTLAVLQNHREGGKHKKNSEEWSKATMKSQLDQAVSHVLLPDVERGTSVAGAGTSGQIVSSGAFDGSFTGKTHIGKRKVEDSCSCIVDSKTGSKDKRQKRAAPFFQPDYRRCSCTRNKVEKSNKELDVGSSSFMEDKTCEGLEVKQFHHIKANISHPKTNIQKDNLKNTSLISKKAKEGELNLMKYYLKMKQNGWILGPGGEWTKSEECEFDSDDEPPKFDEVSKWDK